VIFFGAAGLAAERLDLPGCCATNSQRYRTGGALLDTEALRRILILSKLDPEKIETLVERLEEPRKRYLFLKSLEKAIPANEIAKICTQVSKLSNKLLNVLSTDARGGTEVNLLLDKFGLQSANIYGMMYELYSAAYEAALFMRKGIEGSITAALKEYFEIDEKQVEKEIEDDNKTQSEMKDQPQPDEREIRSRVAAAVLLRSLVASKRKHGQTAETRLFLELRELFIDLGGSRAFSSKPLYRFVEACAKSIDEKIPIPSQPSFRKLLEKATRRGAIATELIE
jgi:hypothetical protein